jgi:hypothetical protein
MILRKRSARDGRQLVCPARSDTAHTKVRFQELFARVSATISLPSLAERAAPCPAGCRSCCISRCVRWAILPSSPSAGSVRGVIGSTDTRAKKVERADRTTGPQKGRANEQHTIRHSHAEPDQPNAAARPADLRPRCNGQLAKQHGGIGRDLLAKMFSEAAPVGRLECICVLVAAHRRADGVTGIGNVTARRAARGKSRSL